MHRRVRGFTLIELMVVVAILCILALIALPKFSDMIRKANEAGTKGHLSNIRAGIRLYYMDNEQIFPEYFNALRDAGGKYLSGSIPLFTGIHPVTDAVDDLLGVDTLSDVCRWGFVNNGPDTGYFWIQCSHMDSSNRIWSQY